MAELRRDPIVQRWVIISAQRGRRPSDFKSSGSQLETPRPGPCDFCGNHEHRTTAETFAFRDGDQPNAPDWRVRVVLNMYPAVSPDCDCGPVTVEGTVFGECCFPGFGSHEVVIETPDHDITLADLPVTNICEVLKAYQVRMKHFRKDPRYKYCQVFKNKGKEAGASLAHSHSQILALPIITDSVEEELRGTQEYYDKHKKCIFCEVMVRENMVTRSRLIDDTSQFITVAPYGPRFPYEIWLLPKGHASNYETIGEDEVQGLAEILKLTLQKLDAAFDHPPYNFMIQTAPLEEEYSEVPYYHWYIRIVPHLTTVAGFELGSGCYINAVAPEKAAEHLRSVRVD